MSEGLPAWLWLAGGFALCAAETLVPGAFLIFFGVAGLAIGAIDLAYPLSLEVQALAFAALAAALAVIGKRFYGSLAARSTTPDVNRAEQMIGRVVYLDSAITEGFGRARVGDSVWRVSGPELAAGDKVKVVAVKDGLVLHVEKA